MNYLYCDIKKIEPPAKAGQALQGSNMTWWLHPAKTRESRWNIYITNSTGRVQIKIC